MPQPGDKPSGSRPPSETNVGAGAGTPSGNSGTKPPLGNALQGKPTKDSGRPGKDGKTPADPPNAGDKPNLSGGGTETEKPGDAAVGPKKDDTGAKPVETTTPDRNAEKPVEKPKPATASPLAILQARPFIIKTLKHDAADAEPRVTGSILSQSLDKMLAGGGPARAEGLTMAALRKLVPEMSRYPLIDKFCTPSGTLIDDEAISILDYLALEVTERTTVLPAGSTRSLQIYFRPTKLGQTASKGANGTNASTVTAPDLSKGPSTTTTGGPAVTTLQKPGPVKELINDSQFGGFQVMAQSGAGKLSEAQWAIVLRNCAVFYGWVIDPRTNSVVRAPKPAFRLRSKVDQEPVASIPDFVSTSTGGPQAKNKDTTSVASPDDTALVKLPPGEKGVKPPVTIQVTQSTPVKPITPKSESIPNFRVNDDSRIEITAHADELSVAMARSDFSSQSTEASVNGGGFGVSVGVSAGYASSKSSTSKSLTSSKVQTIVARYMFPRCDLLLWPNEMEPTAELAELLETIRRTKSIKALRRLHAEYGNLFCQRVTIGGRLLSTKTVQTTDMSKLEEEKQSFKVSVGASVSGGFGGFSASASTKHENEQGSGTVNDTNAKSQKETVVFEAVGGETILAADPKSWSPTVANHELWRIINRDGLSPLVEILSGMPGYEAVQSWFVQAVPALSRYMTLDEAHECRVRLRVTAPTNSMMIRNEAGSASFYLGHDPAGTVTPRLNRVNTTDNFWVRLDIAEEIPIFNPATYRAPAIFGYENYDVGGAKYGSEYNIEFVQTAWDIVAPFDEELANGTRVILRSCPFRDPAATKDTPNTNPSHMVVFRNAQGEFVPAMSDSDEYQYWRIMISNGPNSSSLASFQPRHIKPGDSVRLCWDFRDQTTGWRDFTQDVFGRRQPCAPASLPGGGPLFLKVPWPRFEVAGKPTALILSPDAGELTTKSVTVTSNGTTTAHRYAMQDLHLRIDPVGNGGRGDADDYLLSKVRQEGTEVKVTARESGYPLQMREKMFWLGVYGY
ncbi:hypothetical protein Micbo1qcDRAFT_206580 [Microdochium bolleyi]|uniref:MACPF-like domain-containing protein n=1 Tax=Microdochium bolleyi TaxID=196109 RepID=A0A136IVR2_9PEZI|nr:hypothetical protein Micbo1qcDRAFT_206580 [Microdochium bolleyi]